MPPTSVFLLSGQGLVVKIPVFIKSFLHLRPLRGAGELTMGLMCFEKPVGECREDYESDNQKRVHNFYKVLCLSCAKVCAGKLPGKPWLHFVTIAAFGAGYRTIGIAERRNQARNRMSIWATSTLKNMVRG